MSDYGITFMRTFWKIGTTLPVITDSILAQDAGGFVVDCPTAAYGGDEVSLYDGHYSPVFKRLQ